MSDTPDPQNRIVRYCVDGMEREQEGRHEEAFLLFMTAWNESEDAFERAISAHYVARHQSTAEKRLQWNQKSLSNADAVGGDRVEGFYPSLYLNMGKSHEELGNLKDAEKYYALAAERLGCLPGGRYGDIVRGAVENGIQRLSARLGSKS